MPDSPPRSARRLTWRGKLLLAVLAPVLFLALLELVLGLAGYRRAEVQAPYDRLSRHKSDDAVRIVVLGGSAAAGFPMPRGMGATGFLRELLQDVLPGQRTEVVNAAVNALTSEGVVKVARRLVDYEPDIFIIYTGHNEFFNDPNLNRRVEDWSPDALRWYETTRTYGLLRDLAVMVRGGAPEANQGVTRAERAQLGSVGSPGEYEPDVLAAPYEANLRELVRVAQGAGAQVLLCSLASNLKDAIPTLPKHRTGLTEDELSRWQGHYEEGRRLAQQGQYEQAAGALSQAHAIDDTHAGLLLEEGRVAYALGQYAQARAGFIAARDRDYMPMRATSARNQAVRRVANETDAGFVDVNRAFQQAAPHGCPGNDLFMDYVHLPPKGAYVLARAWAHGLEEHGLGGTGGSWDWSAARSQDACEQALGLTPRVRAVAHAVMAQRCADAEIGGRRVAAFRRPQFVEGLRARGREHFAAALRLAPGAVARVETTPHAVYQCYIALAYIDLGDAKKALDVANKVLDLRPGFVLAYRVKREALVALGQPDRAAAVDARIAEAEGASAMQDPNKPQPSPVPKETLP
jgi:lysophospholipase L1-like esterase